MGATAVIVALSLVMIVSIGLQVFGADILMFYTHDADIVAEAVAALPGMVGSIAPYAACWLAGMGHGCPRHFVLCVRHPLGRLCRARVGLGLVRHLVGKCALSLPGSIEHGHQDMHGGLVQRCGEGHGLSGPQEERLGISRSEAAESVRASLACHEGGGLSIVGGICNDSVIITNVHALQSLSNSSCRSARVEM